MLGIFIDLTLSLDVWMNSRTHGVRRIPFKATMVLVDFRNTLGMGLGFATS